MVCGSTLLSWARGLVSDNRSPGREQASERTKSLVASTVLRMVGNAGGQEVFLGSCLFASAQSPMTHGRFSLGHMDTWRM